MINAEAVVDLNSEVLKNEMESKYFLKQEFTHYGNHCVIFPQISKNNP
jgi:hypothetical protein